MGNLHSFSFEELIPPLKLDDFLDQYWERDRLHIRRDLSTIADDLFSMKDIDRWLASVPDDLADSIVVVPAKGMEDGASRYATGEISKQALYKAFSEGSSIVLNRVNLTWHPLSKITRVFAEIFHASVGVNIYLTPKGSRAFPVHYDGHDVFVLQVHGSKDWRLHEFTELPVPRYSYREHLNFPRYWSRPDEAELLEELTLERGNLLYIPRGMPHAAVSREETSLHLTIGVNSLYWMDLLKMAIEQTCFSVPMMRRALPPGFISDAEIQEEMRGAFDRLLEDFQAGASFPDILKVATRSRLQQQGFPGDGHFEQLLRLDELSLDSVVERRANVLGVVQVLEDHNVASLRFGEGFVRGPMRLRKAFEFIARNERFKVDELPGVDPNGKMILTRRLIRDGLLRSAFDGDSMDEIEKRAPSAMSA